MTGPSKDCAGSADRDVRLSAWKVRPVCQRQRIDLKALAHIRKHFVLSNHTYGRPRITMELKAVGLDVGELRVGRLMKLKGIRPVRTRRYRVTTDSRHSRGVAANIATRFPEDNTDGMQDDAIHVRQGKLLQQCRRCHLSIRQWLLQPAMAPFISRQHQPTCFRS